jgi:hypothetical protein
VTIAVTAYVCDNGSVRGVGQSEHGMHAAAAGPAPEGGTSSSASAKVPRGRLAPRRSRTPTRGGIKRHGACTDSRWSACWPI